MILGACNLLPQEVGHALPALGLPLEVPLDILEVCHNPHQSLCDSGAAPVSPIASHVFPLDVPKASIEGQPFSLFFVCMRMCACLSEDHCETFGVISFFI